MAEKGSSKSSKRVLKRPLNIKRLAYDVLGFTLYLNEVPETKIKTEMVIHNKYNIVNYLLRIYAAVLFISLSSRDKWKRMFESRHKSSGLDNREKIQIYLSTIVNVLPEFQSEDVDKILTSLALYNEFILFLNFKNIGFDLEQFLDMWNSYVTETIARGTNIDELFETLPNSLQFGHPEVDTYLNLLFVFMKDKALPYGNRDVSVAFGEFVETLEKFGGEGSSVAGSFRDTVINQLGFYPHNVDHPIPEVAEESVSLLSSVLERDTVLPGNRDSSPEEPRCPLGFRSPSSGASGVDDLLEQLDISSPSPRRSELLKRLKSKTKRG